MKRSGLVTALLMIGPIAPAAVSAQDSSSTKPRSATQQRLYRLDAVIARVEKSFWFVDSSSRAGPGAIASLRSAVPAKKSDMGVLPGCPMPRLIPDTASVIAMPRARVDTSVDSRMPRAAPRCSTTVVR